jgi:hypothetical protein
MMTPLDRAALIAADARIEDPVGSRPHLGPIPISRRAPAAEMRASWGG